MLDDTLDDVQKAMNDSIEHWQKALSAYRGTIDSPDMSDPVGQAIRGVFACLDELIVLANRDDTKAQVCAERIALGQLLNRCQLLVSFALTEKPGLRLIQNG